MSRLATLTSRALQAHPAIKADAHAVVDCRDGIEVVVIHDVATDEYHAYGDDPSQHGIPLGFLRIPSYEALSRSHAMDLALEEWGLI